MEKHEESIKLIEKHMSDTQSLKQEKHIYSGLEYSLVNVGEKMIKNFEESRLISHPGDKGAARENFLKRYLSDHGYLPPRYSITKSSAYVISTTGHKSKQIDLAIYDSFTAPSLHTIENVQFLPVENVYGMIEVKSDIDSKKTLFDGLEKIESYKTLKAREGLGRFTIPGFKAALPAYNGFGILFSYDASLAWTTILDYMNEWERQKPQSVWPNMIVMLKQGIIAHFKDRKAVFTSDELLDVNSGDLMPIRATGYTNCYLNFYLFLMDLLNFANLPMVPLRDYVLLPTAVGSHSYSFQFGPLLESGTCKEHGSYLKMLTEPSIIRILDTCKEEPAMSFGEAFNLVNNESPNNTNNLGGSLKIYNPEKLAYKNLLMSPNGRGLDVEIVTLDGDSYMLPHYYIFKHSLIVQCPSCKSSEGKSNISFAEWQEFFTNNQSKDATKNS